jgi:hypothetical protein
MLASDLPNDDGAPEPGADAAGIGAPPDDPPPHPVASANSAHDIAKRKIVRARCTRVYRLLASGVCVAPGLGTVSV